MDAMTKRLGRYRLHHTAMTLWYRSRFLIGFTLIGFSSICLELALMFGVMPTEWPRLVRAVLALTVGIAFGYLLNAHLNFRVARPYLLSTFTKYAAVSVLSFSLNYLVISFVQQNSDTAYWAIRLATAATLFLFAYSLHRIYTFDQTRNLGVAVYATEEEDVDQIYRAVGVSCDHIHVDLIDDTMGVDPAPIDLSKLNEVRQYWPGRPVALHLMTTSPSVWIEATGDEVDWILVHLGIEEDLYDVIFQVRKMNKKIGIVWRLGDEPATLFPYLSHVDFVMVLGIAQPGRSGQKVSQDAIDMVSSLDQLRPKYNFELMFDGGVNASTISEITAKYVVSASAVLKASDPLLAVHELRREVHFPVKRAA